MAKHRHLRVTMEQTSLILATITLLTFPSLSDALLHVQLERIEQIGGEHLVDSSGVRVRKFNRTTFTVNGTGILLQDIDDTYEGSLRAAFSRLGNNQWNEYPMKISQKSACRSVIEDYRQYQHMFINYTNLPVIPADAKSFCPIPKGTYWVRDLAPDASWVPPVVPAGYWRLTVDGWRNGEPLGLMRVYLRLTKGLFD